jgi:DNA-binding MurR/RpiR family transcriptional regulator
MDQIFIPMGQAFGSVAQPPERDAAARVSGLTVVGFTGTGGGEIAPICDLCLLAPSDSTPLMQQIHIIIICRLIAERLFSPLYPSACP